MNFFDINPAGRHVSQFAPCPYIAPIPVQELSVVTHTGSFLLKSIGFNIGDCIAITLMLWKHLSSNGVHWRVRLFCANPDNGVVYLMKCTNKWCGAFGKKGCSILKWVVCSKEGCCESEGYKVD